MKSIRMKKVPREKAWKLVPVKLTDAMRDALGNGIAHFVRDRAPAPDLATAYRNYQEAWDYVLAAAPAPEKAQQQEKP